MSLWYVPVGSVAFPSCFVVSRDVIESFSCCPPPLHLLCESYSNFASFVPHLLVRVHSGVVSCSFDFIPIFLMHFHVSSPLYFVSSSLSFLFTWPFDDNMPAPKVSVGAGGF